MKELIIMAAAAMPEEVLLESLKEAIDEYKSVPSEQNQGHLAMSCMMLTLKFKLGDNTKDAVDMIKDLDDIDNKMKLFNTNNN